MFNKIHRGAIFAISLLLSSGTGFAAANTSVAIATGVDPSYSAFYLAQTEGIFEKNGLDVDLRTGSSGSAMVAFLVKNTVQAAFGAEQSGILNFRLDPNVVVAAEGTEVNELYGIIGRNVQSMDDLKGKKIGIARGTGSEVFWLAAIEQLNLDPKDYTIVQVEAPEMIAALERGNIDAFSVWEPWLSRSLESIKDTTKILGQEGILESRVFIYLNKGWAESEPQAAKALITSLVEATALINERPDYAADQVSKYLRLDRKLTGDLMEQYSFGLKLTDASIVNLKLVARQLEEAGKLPEPLDWSQFIYPDVLRSVDPENVNFSLQ